MFSPFYLRLQFFRRVRRRLLRCRSADHFIYRLFWHKSPNRLLPLIGKKSVPPGEGAERQQNRRVNRCHTQYRNDAVRVRPLPHASLNPQLLKGGSDEVNGRRPRYTKYREQNRRFQLTLFPTRTLFCRPRPKARKNSVHNRIQTQRKYSAAVQSHSQKNRPVSNLKKTF